MQPQTYDKTNLTSPLQHVNPSAHCQLIPTTPCMRLITHKRPSLQSSYGARCYPEAGKGDMSQAIANSAGVHIPALRRDNANEPLKRKRPHRIFISDVTLRRLTHPRLTILHSPLRSTGIGGITVLGLQPGSDHVTAFQCGGDDVPRECSNADVVLDKATGHGVGINTMMMSPDLGCLLTPRRYPHLPSR